MRVRGIPAVLALVVATCVAALADAGASAGGVGDWASPVGSLPASVEGSTKSAKVRDQAPVPSCGARAGVVWYTATATRKGPMLATVRALDDTDAVLVVYRLVRSQIRELVCVTTDRKGVAAAPWYAFAGQSYLIGVARGAGSSAGPFTLAVVEREPLPRPPGESLSSAGVSSTVTSFVDAADAWSMEMSRGTSYAINLAVPGACVRLDVYRPGSYAFTEANRVPQAKIPCGGYLLFTPGIDGGGRYSLVVRAVGTRAGERSYRLVASKASQDDTAPGISLANGTQVSGTLDGAGADVLDLYAFTVPRSGSLTTIDYRPSPSLKSDLLVLGETGGKVTRATSIHGRQTLEQKIAPGRYFIALRAVKRSSGAYRLGVVTREVTSATLSAGGSRFVEMRPGTSATLGVYVSHASNGGTVLLEIDRFDPIFRWQFATVITGVVDGGGRFTTSWTPPWAGHWRAHARYLGNDFSTPSQSGYVLLHVAAPLE